MITRRSWLFHAAHISAVQPSVSLALTSAPAFRSVMITSGFLLNRAAYISAVQPRSLSRALTSSPRSMAACICCGVPVSTNSRKVRRLDIHRRQGKENRKSEQQRLFAFSLCFLQAIISGVQSPERYAQRKTAQNLARGGPTIDSRRVCRAVSPGETGGPAPRLKAQASQWGGMIGGSRRLRGLWEGLTIVNIILTV